MRIVLDTNVLVSGLLHSQGNPGKVLALALAGVVHLCHDRRILAEYAEVLARPRFRFDPERAREVLVKLEQDGTSIQASDQPLDLPDADDEPFLAVALASPADYLVTGNLGDYPVEKRRSCAVVSPAEFMRIWSHRHPDPPQASQ
jgi:putative PIN family toxin of toxin-antitoxin system